MFFIFYQRMWIMYIVSCFKSPTAFTFGTNDATVTHSLQTNNTCVGLNNACEAASLYNTDTIIIAVIVLEKSKNNNSNKSKCAQGIMTQTEIMIYYKLTITSTFYYQTKRCECFCCTNIYSVCMYFISQTPRNQTTITSHHGSYSFKRWIF